MPLYIIYALPLLMDVTVSAASLICLMRAANAGFTAAYGAYLTVAWSSAYMLGSWTTGRRVRKENCFAYLLAGCAAVAPISLAMLVWRGVGAQFVLMPLLTLSMALFFPSFQVFMKLVDQGRKRPVSESSGVYTCAWSAGFALGPLATGCIWHYCAAHSRAIETASGLRVEGWEALHLFNAAVGLACVALLLYARRLLSRAQPAPEPPANDAPSPATAPERLYDGMSNLVWLGWLSGGIGIVVNNFVRTMYPFSAKDYGLGETQQGNALFLACLTQAAVALALSRSRTWMYRSGPMLLFGLAGAVGTALLCLSTQAWHFYAAFALFGIYCGSMYPYFVFHSLVHPQKSGAYIGWNETIVGLAGIVGPLLCGAAAAGLGHSRSYLPPALALLLVATLQFAVHRGKRDQSAALRKRALQEPA